jgi:hypothetical protein
MGVRAVAIATWIACECSLACDAGLYRVWSTFDSLEACLSLNVALEATHAVVDDGRDNGDEELLRGHLGAIDDVVVEPWQKKNMAF